MEELISRIGEERDLILKLNHIQETSSILENHEKIENNLQILRELKNIEFAFLRKLKYELETTNEQSG